MVTEADDLAAYAYRKMAEKDNEIERLNDIITRLNEDIDIKDVEVERLTRSGHWVVERALRAEAEVERWERIARDYEAASGKYLAEVERLRAENKQLLLTKAGAFKAQMEYAAEVQRVKKVLTKELTDALAQRDEARVEVERLRAGFRRFADHRRNCDLNSRYSQRRGCTCGYDEARAALAKDPLHRSDPAMDTRGKMA